LRVAEGPAEGGPTAGEAIAEGPAEGVPTAGVAIARGPAEGVPTAGVAIGGALRGFCAAVVAAFAALGAVSVGPAVHDDGIVRAVGAGYTGAFRALDLWVASPAMLLPFGTRAFRAGLASAFVAGLCAYLLFDVARELAFAAPRALERIGWGGPASPRQDRLAVVVSAVAVLAALLAPSWQSEAAAPAGAVTGAAIVLAALRVRTMVPAGLVLGLATSYEPFVLLAALAAMAPELVENVRRESEWRRSAGHALAGFAVGLMPLALGIVAMRRVPELALDVPLFTFLQHGVPASLKTFALTEIGFLLLVATGAGIALALLVPSVRRSLLSLAAVAVVGALAVQLGAHAGPNRFDAVVLAALACALVLGATTLAAVVLAIARARVPFAEASAALVVVLELVLPVRAIDETLTRREAHAKHGAAVWTDIAWGGAPPAAVLLVPDRGTMRRIASARASGDMRGDLVVVPAYDVQGREGQHALIREPKLAALYRDMALGIAPEELSLAQLGSQRALLAAFDPKWDRTLARHLVPVGLLSRFEPEPRGASDRKHALESFLPAKDRLVRIAVAKRDPELAAATATLLRSRAIGMAATGEREMLSRALDDLRAFAPDDPVGTILVRRIVTTKGPIDIHDL
jgi:hypothetical protein